MPESRALVSNAGSQETLQCQEEPRIGEKVKFMSQAQEGDYTCWCMPHQSPGPCRLEILTFQEKLEIWISANVADSFYYFLKLVGGSQ